MQFSTFTTADWIAVIGGITGIIGGIAGIISLIISIITLKINWQTYNRDQGLLAMEYSGGLLSQPPFTDFHIFKIANKGRRTITLSNVGLVFLKKDGWTILSDNAISWGKKELEEGKNVQYSIKKTDLDTKPYSHVKIIDETGKEYFFPIAPAYKRIFYNFLHKTGISKKQSVFKK